MIKFKEINQNDRIVLKNAFGAFVVKGGALAVSLLSTPAFIKYFNDNIVLGLWYTLLSVLTWFLNFDLGIGNGIRNNLVKAFTSNDRKSAKYIISSGLFSISIVTAILAIVGICLGSMMDLNKVFNISQNVISKKALFYSVIFIFLAIMIRFFLTTVSSIFYALQMSAINNFLALCVSILQLLYIVLFHFDNSDQALITLAFAYMIISNLPMIVAAGIIFCTKLKDCKPDLRYIKKEYMQSVLKIGGIFFICQILYMLIVNTNEFFITKLFGPEYTTDYTFYYKITSLVSMVITLAMTPVWSVVTKAMTEENWEWLNKLYQKIRLIGMIVVLMEFFLIPFMQSIMDIWLRDHAIRIDYITALAFACFGSAFVYSSMLSTIVCGLARMKLQVVCYAVGVTFKIVFVICLSRIIDNWNIVVWSNALLLTPYCILQQIDLSRFFRRKINKN